MLAARHGRPAVVGTKTSPTDVVTEMDQAAERLIRRRILAERPDDAILGEEGGQTGGDAPVRWIVDPLGRDGELPVRAARLGRQHCRRGRRAGGRRSGLRAAQGCDLRRDARRRCLAGQCVTGADAEPLACNADVPLARALIATGFGYERARRGVQGEVLSAILPRVRDIRRNGACAVDLCSLAAGNVDGYYERGVQYWDIAAGSLIAREAGAVVGGLAGKPAGPSMTIGGGPALFAELHDLLLGLDAERDA